MTLGKRIQDLRKRNGYSQENVAEKLCMSRQAIAKWEQNICEPNIDCLIKMASLFNVDLNYLITGNKEENEKKAIRDKKLFDSKNDIILLLMIICSILIQVLLFAFSLFNPIYFHQKSSFIWWYLLIWRLDGLWFRFISLLTIVIFVFSIIKFLKRKKNV